ncbi:MAG: Maf family protein [Syntrophobacteraceae bacterium]
MFRNRKPLVLASNSPRRSELLRSAGVFFEVRPGTVEEPTVPDGRLGPEDAAAFAQNCARLKARSVSVLQSSAWVLGADTIVVVGGRIFGKPSDGEGASQMLETLSNREHEVITGICLAFEGRVCRLGSVATRVRFKPLSHEEIAAYVKTGEPFDKAGAYGIQGAGAFLVRSLSGSYTNVVGLPLTEIIEWLMEENIIEPE